MGKVLDALLAELAESRVGFKHDQPTGTPSTPYMTGPGGLFTTSGVEQDLISTRVAPLGGLGSLLPAIGTMLNNPLFGYVTGFRDITGTVPSGVCDTPQTAGAMKNCLQTAAFGRYSLQTRELELNRVGLEIDRSTAMLNLRILNDPLLNGPVGGLTTPNVPTNAELAREVLVRFMELGVGFQEMLMPQLFEGNPANNSAGGGSKEFPGLDMLISTGKRDAETGTPCPSLDSQIFDWNFGRVDANTTGFIARLSYTMRFLRMLADQTGLAPVDWVIAMRPGLFWELTAIWPCQYMTDRCGFSTSDGTKVVNVDGGDMIAMRDDMRNNQYLVIDGIRYPVVLDTSINEDTNTTSASVTSGCFASDIYIVPLRVANGFLSTYWEYLDYSKGAMVGAAQGQYANDDFWTDGGRFLWHKLPPKMWCVQWAAKVEPRVILRTPHLAARIQNVQYCPLLHERDPFHDDPYFVNGGVTSRSARTLYSDWNTDTPA